jgi:prepilin-type N-terminal cleavage/methylation domain-containing protein
MIPFRNTIKHPVKNKKGFTLLELIVVIALISILASIAMANFIPLKRQTYDTTARSDARNILESAVVALLNDEDVNYLKPVGDTGSVVGGKDNAGNPRTPVFVLSSGVRAVITGNSLGPDGSTTILSATVYHIKGTDDPGATMPAGKREYICYVHEGTGVTILP